MTKKNYFGFLKEPFSEQFWKEQFFFSKCEEHFKPFVEQKGPVGVKGSS